MRDLAADDMQIAVSIRYLQIKGASHAHIYLYSGNGKLIRRLTNDEILQDVHPVFSPDGDEIVFTRQRGATDELGSVNVSGKNAHLIDRPLISTLLRVRMRAA